MKNEIIVRFLEYHVGGDDKLRINFVWSNYIASLPFSRNQNKYCSSLASYIATVSIYIMDIYLHSMQVCTVCHLIVTIITTV